MVYDYHNDHSRFVAAEPIADNSTGVIVNAQIEYGFHVEASGSYESARLCLLEK